MVGIGQSDSIMTKKDSMRDSLDGKLLHHKQRALPPPPHAPQRRAPASASASWRAIAFGACVVSGCFEMQHA